MLSGRLIALSNGKSSSALSDPLNLSVFRGLRRIREVLGGSHGRRGWNIAVVERLDLRAKDGLRRAAESRGQNWGQVLQV